MKLIISLKVTIYLALISGLVLLLGIVLGYKIFPDIIEKKVWENSVLKENTPQWGRFMKTPVPFQFKIYIFNVENSEAILEGQKPVVKEVGPYVYKLHRWKSDINWDLEGISYFEYSFYEFDNQASGNLSDLDYVTVINSPFNTLIFTVEELSPAILETLNEALPTIFQNNNNLFMKIRVKDFFFDGIKLCENNGKSDFGAKMICKELKSKTKTSKTLRVGNNSILFANLYHKNNTHLGRFKINSGQIVKESVNNLLEYNNQTYVNFWAGDQSKCNQIRGTTTFHPFIERNMVFETFGEDICRHLTMNFEKEEAVKGINGYKFIVRNDSFNTPMERSENSCFCLNKTKMSIEDSECLRNGLVDMSTCLGAPVLLSFPHLLYADKTYSNSIEGLQPNPEYHRTFVVLEPTSGAPLKVVKRVQFNMFIRPVQDILITQNITNSLIPMFWIEELLVLDDDNIQMIKTNLLNNLKLLDFVKWILIVTGAVGVCISGVLILNKKF